MIDRAGTVSLFVSNNVMGFELHTDQLLYSGVAHRWVAVAPMSAATEVILCLPDENWQHYRSSGVGQAALGNLRYDQRFRTQPPAAGRAAEGVNNG